MKHVKKCLTERRYSAFATCQRGYWPLGAWSPTQVLHQAAMSADVYYDACSLHHPHAVSVCLEDGHRLSATTLYSLPTLLIIAIINPTWMRSMM